MRLDMFLVELKWCDRSDLVIGFGFVVKLPNELIRRNSQTDSKNSKTVNKKVI